MKLLLGVLNQIYAKALAIDDAAGRTAVPTTTKLSGFAAALTSGLSGPSAEPMGCERRVL
jgi:hypothetical protein